MTEQNHRPQVSVRPAQPADRTAVHRVVEAAFGPDEGPLIVRLIGELDATRRNQAALVAEADGVVVGHVQLNRSWVDARPALVDVLVLSPLSVAPDHQRRGIGGVLLEAALETARSLAAPAVFLEGSPDYYGSRGFAPAGDLGFTRPSPRIPQAAFQVALLPGHEEWMVGPLVYCDAFWSHDCVGLRDPLLADLEQRFGAPE